MLINLRDKILSRYGKTSFTKSELSIILGAYGEKVQSGQWRDYAIDTFKGTAVFSIYRSTSEQPIFSVSKVSTNKKNQPIKYQLSDNKKVIKESKLLSDIIDVLREQK